MKKFIPRSYISFSGLVTLVSLSLFPLLAAAQIKYTVESHLGVDTIEQLLLAILNIVITIAIPIVVLFIIYAGFLYVTAKGNAQQIQQATRALTYAIIGGVLIIGAVAISQVIGNIINAFSA